MAKPIARLHALLAYCQDSSRFFGDRMIAVNSLSVTLKSFCVESS